MYCIVDRCFYFIWWLLKEPFVYLFAWFICLFPRSVQVGAGFQQLLGWPYIGLVFIPQVKQFCLEVTILVSLDTFEFPVWNKAIWRAVSLAFLCSNWIRRYKGSYPCLEAWWLRPWCHPAMSLFVLTAFLNTVQSEGLQVVPLIQLLDTYSVKGCKEAGAWPWRWLNIRRISFSGRNGSASIFLMKYKVLRLWLYTLCKPSSCT